MYLFSPAKVKPCVPGLRQDLLILMLLVPIMLLLNNCGSSPSSLTSSSPAQNPGQGTPGAGGSSSGSASPAPADPTQPAPPAPSNPAPAPPPPAPGSPPAGASVISGIQILPGWAWCTAKLNGKPCAAGLGNATSSMTQKQNDPSLSGNSSLFTLGGKTQYSNALWWKSLGHNNTAEPFVYDLYFYMKDPSAPEALEFDVNQSWGGTRYTWGTECSYRDTAYWDIWDPKTEMWETTNVPCPQVSANTWHHLVWQLERVNGQVHYISVTLDDEDKTVDKYYDPQKGWKGDDVNVALQLDGDYRQTPYDVWLDNVTLTSW